MNFQVEKKKHTQWKHPLKSVVVQIQTLNHLHIPYFDYFAVVAAVAQFANSVVLDSNSAAHSVFSHFLKK
jgi:hypothetical protein